MAFLARSIQDFKMDVTKVDEVLNVETLRLEVQVLSMMLEDFKYMYCKEHKLDRSKLIDITDKDFLPFFFKEYIAAACNYKCVYMMVRMLDSGINPIVLLKKNYLTNKRGECIKVKEAKFPDFENPKVKNEMMFNLGGIANLLESTRSRFCRNHFMDERELIDINNWDFLVYLFEEHAEHVNEMGGNLLYDKLDFYVAFMNR